MALPVKDPSKPSGPVQVKNLRIHVDRDLCIGAATCAAIAPHTFALDGDAKAVVLDSADNETEQAILDAARGCPVAAIILENEKGEKVYPK
jgi:ferredoxin